MQSKKIYWLLGFSFLSLFNISCERLNEIDFIEFASQFDFPPVVRLGEEVQFIPGPQSDAAVLYRWRFGDAEESTSNLGQPFFTYDSVGRYQVELKVEIDKRLSRLKDSIQKEIVVLPPTEPFRPEQTIQFGDVEVDERASVIVSLEGGGLGVAGQININSIFVFKSDLDLSIQEGWPRVISNFSTGQIRVNDMIETLDGGLLIVGSLDYDNGDRDAYILKLDDQGNEIWRELINSDKDETYTGVIQNDLGEILVGGTFFISGRPGIVVNRYSSEGDLLQPKSLSRAECNSCTALSLEATNDGGFIIAGTQIDQPLLAKFSPQSNLEGISVINGISGRGLASLQLEDGKYILVGESRSPVQDSSNAFIAKFDFVGGPENWRQDLALYQESFVDVAQDNNGDLVVLGQHSNPLTNSDVLLAKYENLRGTLIELRLLGDAAENQALGFNQGALGRLRVIGFTGSSRSRFDALLLLLGANFWER